MLVKSGPFVLEIERTSAAELSKEWQVIRQVVNTYIKSIADDEAETKPKGDGYVYYPDGIEGYMVRFADGAQEKVREPDMLWLIMKHEPGHVKVWNNRTIVAYSPDRGVTWTKLA